MGAEKGGLSVNASMAIQVTLGAKDRRMKQDCATMKLVLLNGETGANLPVAVQFALKEREQDFGTYMVFI